MSGIPMMELNAKGAFLWDWENMDMYSTKTLEVLKNSHLIDSDIHGMEDFEVGSLYSCIDSEVKGSGQFRLKINDVFQEDDPRIKREVMGYGSERSSSIMGSSVVSGESLIALELGERTYFKDVSEGRNSGTTKKSKSCVSTEVPRCQVEGCNLDLSSAKDYHRKHRVCENHSKSPKVIINGLERRFCQQCSRFHGLSEFVERKRSCRRRLSDHNARRRKPKPELMQFNSMLLPPSLYVAEGGKQLSFGFNQAPVLQNRNDSWDSKRNSKMMHPKPSIDDILANSNGVQSPGNTYIHSLSFQGTPSHIFHRQPGFAASMEVSNVDGAQDLGALSLLSTGSWGGSCEPQSQPSPVQLPVPMHTNHGSMAQPLPAFPLGDPPLSSGQEYWAAKQSSYATNASAFQLFKASNHSSYLY